MGVASLVLGIISIVIGVFSAGSLGWFGAFWVSSELFSVHSEERIQRKKDLQQVVLYALLSD